MKRDAARTHTHPACIGPGVGVVIELSYIFHFHRFHSICPMQYAFRITTVHIVVHIFELLVILFVFSSLFSNFFNFSWPFCRMLAHGRGECACECIEGNTYANTITIDHHQELAKNETIIHFIIPAGTFVSSVIGFRHRFHRSIVVSAIYYLFVIVWLLP